MQTEVISNSFILGLYGFSGVALNNDHAGTAFRLMDKMWNIVRENKLSHKGLNIWVYEPGNQVFAGVELEESPPPGTGLEYKYISLTRYGYYKHTGPYPGIKAAGQRMKEELTGNGYVIAAPYIEIYGHWTNDETKLETELLMSIA